MTHTFAYTDGAQMITTVIHNKHTSIFIGSAEPIHTTLPLLPIFRALGNHREVQGLANVLKSLTNGKV